MIRDVLEKKYGGGASWHVVVGEGFGFDIAYELKSLMYMFFAGNLAVCAWKCSWKLLLDHTVKKAKFRSREVSLYDCKNYIRNTYIKYNFSSVSSEVN